MVGKKINAYCITCKEAVHEIVAEFPKMDMEKREGVISRTLLCGCGKLQYSEQGVFYGNEEQEQLVGDPRFTRVDYDNFLKPKLLFKTIPSIQRLYKECVSLYNEKRWLVLSLCLKKVIDNIFKEGFQKHSKAMKADNLHDTKKIENLESGKVLTANLADGLKKMMKVIEDEAIYEEVDNEQIEINQEWAQRGFDGHIQIRFYSTIKLLETIIDVIFETDDLVDKIK